jgi:regulatory protein YycI of two-component signal transduction system YycFG
MNIALIIISVFLLLENIALAIVFFIGKAKRKTTTNRNKRIRTEFNSAMINMRRLENLFREDKNEAN